MKYKIEDVYYVGKISNHNKIKNSLIQKVESSENVSIISNNYNISKTDWLNSEKDRDWVKFFIDNCIDDIKLFYQDMGYESFTIDNVWFQQYYKNSSHDWHTHSSSNFSNVYFLELPHNSSPTEIIIPYSGDKKILNAREGEMIIFPAHIYHRSPINLDDKNRTVLVFNSSINV